MTRTRTRICTRYRAVAIEIPVEIDVDMKLGEKADHSPTNLFAACSTLDRAVYRLADEQRAALIQFPTHAYHTSWYMSTAVHSVYAQTRT